MINMERYGGTVFEINNSNMIHPNSLIKKHANGTYKINSNIGIIGDSPGSGKTLLTLSLININNKFSQYNDVGIPCLSCGNNSIMTTHYDTI